jgi:hypothetical protein
LTALTVVVFVRFGVVTMTETTESQKKRNARLKQQNIKQYVAGGSVVAGEAVGPKRRLDDDLVPIV